MNFLFVDQILELEPGKKATGLKHVSAQDMYLTPTASGTPALLPCIVGEALGQLNSWCLIKNSDFKQRSIGGIVPEVNVYQLAYLGDTILLEIEVDYVDEKAMNWHGKASVNGQVILDVHSIGPCVDMEMFNDPNEVRTQYEMIYRPDQIPEFTEGQAIIPSSLRYYNELYSYDKILAFVPGKQLTAQKNISLIAPYFQDHFPRKPVLPITLLLQSNFQLAEIFLQEQLGDAAKEFIPSKVYRVKMNDFVLPGQSIVTTLKLIRQTDNEVTFDLRSVVNGKRVCVAKAQLTRQTP